MTNNAPGGWGDWVLRAIALFRPKYYNVISRVLIFFGIGIIIHANVGVINVIIVDLYEKYFGKSELLRTYVLTESSPWVGFAIIFVALVFNYFSKISDTPSATATEIPSFSLALKNIDGDVMRDRTTFRGVLCKVPDYSKIPDYQKPQHPLRVQSFSYSSGDNSSFYHQRAQLLEEWGGSEVISLEITNTGNVVSRKVTVEIEIKAFDCQIFKNENDLKPKIPREERDLFGIDINRLVSPPSQYDITGGKDDDEIFRYIWVVGDLQAKAKSASWTKLFAHIETQTSLSLKIFCDEFSSPTAVQQTLLPPEETENVGLDIIKSSRERYWDFADRAIMDGYLSREFDRILKKRQ